MNTETTPTIRQCLDQAQEKLASANSGSDSDSAKLEAEVLLAFALDKPRSFLYTWPEQTIENNSLEQFNRLVERRYAGEPVAYITGIREFWGLSFKVTPDVLIPRPETERLVEIALEHIPEQRASRIADLGTGSGAIALAIASERPLARIDATDHSEAALAIAAENQASLELSNIHLHEGSWFEPFFTDKFNLIISNPPYVAANDPHLQQGDLRFEPASALSSGPDGLDDLRYLINESPRYLLNGGYLLLEHGFDQADAVARQFEQTGFQEVQCFQDYGQRERATIARWLK